MAKWETIAIVGVGLIGGSIGLAVRRRGLARRVIGIGRRSSRLQQARRLGAVTTTTTRLAAGVADAELVIVCTPVDRIVGLIEQVGQAAGPRTLITDVGSTKAEIVRAVERRSDLRPRFVGSHPLAGSDRSGVRHARPDLLEGRVTVVTPTARTDPHQLANMKRFWRALGSEVLSMTPAAHDRSLAMTSHAAHVVASTLALATGSTDLRLAASGWADTTRIAAADPELWCQILLSNRSAVLKSLEKFATVLSEFRGAIEQADPAQITQLLDAGKQIRDNLGS
jgi:prephenate dehydrogenase